MSSPTEPDPGTPAAGGQSSPAIEAKTLPRTLLALAPEELARVFAEFGAKPFHARIARENVLAKGLLEYAAMTSLPASLRADLERELPIFVGRETACSSAPDRTTKLLIEFPRAKERDASVEVVHMPSLAMTADPDENERDGATLCVSTQAGCPTPTSFPIPAWWIPPGCWSSSSGTTRRSRSTCSRRR